MDFIEELAYELGTLTLSKSRGIFITFEGGDGAGKTTQIRLLSQVLEGRNIPHVSTREPGGTPGEKIRDLLVNGAPEGWDGVSEAFLVAAARREHLRRLIWPALEEGKWVLCDRFADSTFAYQGFAHGLGRAFVETLNELTMGRFRPDLTFVFQLSEDSGLARKKETCVTEDRYERFPEMFHKRVSEGYRTLLEAEPDRCVAVPADASIETVAHHIWKVLEERKFLKPS